MSGKTKVELQSEIISLKQQLKMKTDLIESLENRLVQSRNQLLEALNTAKEAVNKQREIAAYFIKATDEIDGLADDESELFDIESKIYNELLSDSQARETRRASNILNNNRKATEMSDYLKERYAFYLDDGCNKQDARKEANIDVSQRYGKLFKARTLYKHLK